MKKFRLIIAIFFCFILGTYLFKVYRDFNNSKELKKEEKNRLQKSAEILSKCFDLKNKNKRSITESMDLIEYCLDNYGNKN